MRSLLLLAPVLLLAPALLAQPPLDFDYSFSDSLTLLRLEEVHADLKLTVDQFEKVREVLKPLREKYVKQATVLFKDKGGDKLDKLQEDIKQEGLQAVEKVLKPEQFRRLKQLCVQQRGYKAFTDKNVQQALKLSDNQLKQVPMLLAEREQKVKNLRVIGFKEVEKIDAETTAAQIGILTPDQKKQWQELVGPELKINRFGILQRLK